MSENRSYKVLSTDWNLKEWGKFTPKAVLLSSHSYVLCNTIYESPDLIINMVNEEGAHVF